MNIAVICGGISTERNVAVTGGKAVKEALESLGHHVVLIDPAYGNQQEKWTDINTTDMKVFTDMEELSKFSTRNYIDCINSRLFDNIDAAFIVLHGRYGEDGLIQSLLELRGIPYTGSGVAASALSSDKAKAKMIFSSVGVLTPQWTTITKSDIEIEGIAQEIRNYLGKEIVIKPNDQGSTIGLTIIENGNLDEIHEALILAAKYSDNILVEKYIPGREITVGIVGNTVLPVIEIVTEDGFYDYKHKYTKGKTNYICPAEISEDIAEFTQNMALTAYNSLGCKGFARIDFRLDDEGQPFCLEVNSIPGFTSQSLVPMAAREIGIEFPELCMQLINIALNIEEEEETEE